MTQSDWDCCSELALKLFSLGQRFYCCCNCWDKVFVIFIIVVVRLIKVSGREGTDISGHQGIVVIIIDD